jgi:hypothetical protein
MASGSTQANSERAVDILAQATATLEVHPTPPATSSQTLSGPVIAYFTCDPCAVEPGGAAKLDWDLSGATAAYLDGQGITAPGSTVVYPDQTTTYRLVAVSDIGQSEKTVTVEVRGLPTIYYFTCLPCEITKGEQSTLNWDLSGATAAYLDGYGVTAPGSMLVAPGQTTTYRLTAVGEGGSMERLVTVTVKEAGDPETVHSTLQQSGYDVRWVGHLQLAEGGATVSAIMASASRDLWAPETAYQYFEGFKALYENYPDRRLSVGLYDGARYIAFVTVESVAWEAFLRGEADGLAFWRGATWNFWDEWTGHWLTTRGSGFLQKDFVSKSFGF